MSDIDIPIKTNSKIGSKKLVGSFNYPIKAIGYFFKHPILWAYVIVPLLLSLVAFILALVLFFTLALDPQQKALSNHMPNDVAWLVAVILVLAEITVTLALFVSICFSCFIDKIVEQTLKIEKIEIGYETHCCNIAKDKFFHWIFGFSLALVTAPLNIIPIVGSILFCYMNGFHTAWETQIDYFTYKGMSFKQQYKFINENIGEYRNFGAACTGLTLIPLLQFLFIFTNSIAGALWIVDIERGDYVFKHPLPDYSKESNL